MKHQLSSDAKEALDYLNKYKKSHEDKQISRAKLQFGLSWGFLRADKVMKELEENGLVEKRKTADADEIKSITIMKYQGSDGKYYFIVKDKFDVADEVERLEAMNALRDKMLASGEMKKHLWTKETVLF